MSTLVTALLDQARTYDAWGSGERDFTSSDEPGYYDKKADECRMIAAFLMVMRIAKGTES